MKTWRRGKVKLFDFLGNTSLLWPEQTKTTIRQRRIENMASSMKVTGPTSSSARTVQRPEMNMDIDTLRLVSVVWIGWYAAVAPEMVCNGMQWYAMACNGMQWHAMVWNGMIWSPSIDLKFFFSSERSEEEGEREEPKPRVRTFWKLVLNHCQSSSSSSPSSLSYLETWEHFTI